MDLLVCLSLCLNMLAPKDVLEVPVNHVRASRLAVQLKELTARGTPAYAVTITARDEQAKLILEGEKSAIEEVARFVPLFDVRPRELQITFEIDLPLEKQSFGGRLSTANNHTVTYSQNRIGLSLDVTPRIGDDGSITLFVKARFEGTEVQAVARVRNGEVLDLQRLGTQKDKPMWPWGRLAICTTIVEDRPKQ
jgi:type II secretory pathway component GspD/PulD (secretin)